MAEDTLPSPPRPRHTAAVLALVTARRLGHAILVLVAIAFLSYWGMTMAQNAVNSAPVEPLQSAVNALRLTVAHIVHHPASYIVHREPISPWRHVSSLLGNSLTLLFAALFLGCALGIPLGTRAAQARSGRAGSLVWLISIAGVSVPAFMLAMFLWALNIGISRQFHLTPLPASGLGFNRHMVLPTLILAARPFAMLTQVTYVTFSGLLSQDFVRTARSKGLAPWVVQHRHVMRNAWIPLLTAMSTSLRVSLATLPVVEYFFAWPGIGLGLLDAIRAGEMSTAVDMVLALGAVFLAVNSVLEAAYALLDPRLREQDEQRHREEATALRQAISGWWERLAAGWQARLRRRPTDRATPVPLVPLRRVATAAVYQAGSEPDLSVPRPRSGLRVDPVLLLAGALTMVLVGLTLFGGKMTDASPYVAHGVMVVEGQIGSPPYPPSSVFPWGTDQVGRDMQALVLEGARQTLTLALLVVAARLAVGVMAGMVAGWWKGSWLDRLVLGVLSVWAAFPITLFAMILILAVGIERGISSFVLALCLVGWGEIAQYVRSEVIALRGMPFLDGARAVGSPPEAILYRHILPNLAPSILVLAPLEMGSVLLVLAELGFLGIFVGGGYRVMIGEVGSMVPVIAFYSDVPEWSALLANIREWWRSYPWLAWSPAIAFSLAILTFNMAGEAMRRVMERSRLSPTRWINRATLAALPLVTLVGAWVLSSSAPLAKYRPQAEGFQVERPLRTVDELSTPAYAGRETGTEGARKAAEYIAAEMAAAGLLPGGQRDPATHLETYFWTQPAPRVHLTGVPTMTVIEADGGRRTLAYRVDFAEYALGVPMGDRISGRVVGIAAGTVPENPGDDPFGLNRLAKDDAVLLVREELVPSLPGAVSPAVLVVGENPAMLERRYLFPGLWTFRPGRTPYSPMLVITSDLADELLSSSGTSLTGLDDMSAGLGVGEAIATLPGDQIEIDLPIGEVNPGEAYISVIGYIPGQGAEVGMDDDVIVVSAYYDGLGIGPQGEMYPGANDNLSGVATMLELARVLRDGTFSPDKTMVFIAWAGGERWENLNLAGAMSAKVGFDQLNVEAVLELSGVGGGDGKGLALGPGTSYRLFRLIQAAASRFGLSVTTRGRGPHTGLPATPGFAERKALSALISWDGADKYAHTIEDTPANLEPQKLGAAGKTMALVLTVLSRESTY